MKDDYLESLMMLRLETLHREYPNKSKGELIKLYKEERKTQPKKERDAIIESDLRNKKMSLMGIVFILKQFSDCKFCPYLQNRDADLYPSCQQCGCCLLEKEGYIHKDDSKEVIENQINFISLLFKISSSIMPLYSDLVTLHCQKEDMEKSVADLQVKIDEMNASLARRSHKDVNLNSRKEKYYMWHAMKPQPKKAWMARELGISVRQLNRDLERLNLHFGKQEKSEEI